jgi:hypothetical protein
MEFHELRKPPDQAERAPFRKANSLPGLVEMPRDPLSLHEGRTSSMTSKSPSLEYLIEPCSSVLSSRKRGDPRRQPTLDKIPPDKQNTRVPPSKTPSPTKIPGNDLHEATASPVKISSQVTKALQDSITSLLGKRQISEDDLTIKFGKRPRPQLKSKVFVMFSYRMGMQILFFLDAITTNRCTVA